MKLLLQKYYQAIIKKYGERDAVSVLGSRFALLYILINCVLASSKIVIGLIQNSLALQADGVNNFTDCIAAGISLFSFYISSKPADKEHPFGHARSEHIGGTALCYLIFTFSFMLIYRSIIKIGVGGAVELEFSLILVLLISVLIKLLFYLLTHYFAKISESTLLRAFSLDSISDVAMDILLLLVIFLQSKLGEVFAILGIGISGAGMEDIISFIDSAAAVLIAVIIAINGYKILRDIFNRLLGQDISAAEREKIERSILAVEGINALHDLYIYDYGPGRVFATVHIEVRSDLSLLKAHDISDRVERKIAKHFSISLVAHLDPVENYNYEEKYARLYTAKCLKDIDESLTLHDFRLLQGKYYRNLCFDVRLPERDKEPKGLFDRFASLLNFRKNRTKKYINDERLAEKIRAYFYAKNPRDNVVVRIERGNIGLPFGQVKMGEKK